MSTLYIPILNPNTLNPKPNTLNPEPSTVNLEP